MTKTKTTCSIRNAGITYSTTSTRNQATFARASDWLWFLLALLAVVAIYLL